MAGWRQLDHADDRSNNGTCSGMPLASRAGSFSIILPLDARSVRSNVAIRSEPTSRTVTPYRFLQNIGIKTPLRLLALGVALTLLQRGEETPVSDAESQRGVKNHLRLVHGPMRLKGAAPSESPNRAR